MAKAPQQNFSVRYGGRPVLKQPVLGTLGLSGVDVDPQGKFFPDDTGLYNAS